MYDVGMSISTVHVGGGGGGYTIINLQWCFYLVHEYV